MTSYSKPRTAGAEMPIPGRPRASKTRSRTRISGDGASGRSSPQRGARPVQTRPHRADGHVQGFGDLLVVERRPCEQEDDIALSRGQRGERGVITSASVRSRAMAGGRGNGVIS